MTNSEFAQALREMAAFYEGHPEMPHPSPVMHKYIYGRDEFTAAVKQLADGGVVTKQVTDKPLDDFQAVRDFGGIKLKLSIDRRTVCRKVKKMVETEVWECPESILESESVTA